MTKVVVLSASFSKSMPLRRKLLSLFHDVKFNDAGQRFSQPELIKFIGNAELVVVGLDRVDESLLKACPSIKCITKYGVGLDGIDQTACNRHGVQVAWRPGVNALSVAEHALMMMLSLMHNAFPTSLALKQGVWDKSGGSLLSQKTVGIFGLGHIGQALVKLLKPFNCQILANDIRDVSGFAALHGVNMVSKELVYRSSDILTLHLPLTDETRGLINVDALKEMKKGAYLLNTARGQLIDHCALFAALQSGALAGVGLDVYEQEPPKNEALLSLPNVICTPHIAGNTAEAVLAMGMAAIEGLEEYVSCHVL